ncbi:MAG: hypothetical protein RBR08_06245 [Desulforegulaceae bacterium]|nr:hypothetical protein [Desulforegulaceae bacterium]
MPKISKKALASATRKVNSMDIKAKELAFEDVFAEQPNLLASILVQHRLGNTMNDVESLLHILLVLHFAIKEAGIVIPKISEHEQQRQLEILEHSVLFSEGMSSNLAQSSVNQYINNHKEPVLLAYVIGAMQEAGFLKNKNEASKFLIMTGINLVSCIAEA